MGFLNDGQLRVQPRRGNRVAHGLTELGDDNLHGFLNYVQGALEGDEDEQRSYNDDYSHQLPPPVAFPPVSRFKSGTRLFRSWSTTIFLATWGKIEFMVSR